MARDARTPLANPSDIDMIDPRLTFERPGRSPFHAKAAAATVDTNTHVVVVPGITSVATDDGLSGTLADLRSDMRAEITTADGPVDITFPDGSHLTAANMHFDGKTSTWSFDRATLVVNATPVGLRDDAFPVEVERLPSGAALAGGEDDGGAAHRLPRARPTGRLTPGVVRQLTRSGVAGCLPRPVPRGPTCAG